MSVPSNSVAVGWSSILGWLGSAAALVLCIVQSVEEAQPLLSGTNKPAGLIAAGLLIATHAGRQYQAKPGTTVIEAAPAPEPALVPPSYPPIEAAADPAPVGVVDPPLPPPAA